MKAYSPIVLFIYKRASHLEKTLISLMKCKNFDKHVIYVFGDGARFDSENDLVIETRLIAEKYLGNKAEYFYSNKNMGLANSVINGVSKIINLYGSVIVIEDDLLLHHNFLVYMNEALLFYKTENKVFSVSGYMYNIENDQYSNKALLLPLISTWGWGTWKRAWDFFDIDALSSNLLLKNRKFRKSFNCNNSYPFTDMLERQIKGNIDSWGIRWYLTVYMNNALTCFPPSTLVLNNGFDNSATHGKGLFTKFSKNKPLENLNSDQYIVFNSDYEFNKKAFDSVCNALYYLSGGFLGKLRDMLKYILYTGIFFITRLSTIKLNNK